MLDTEKRQEEQRQAPPPVKRRSGPRILLDTDRAEGPALPFLSPEKPQTRITVDPRGARPTCRAECAGVARPCHHVSCSHNLFLREDPKTGELKPRYPGKKHSELKHSCALDLIERLNAMNGEEVREILNCSQDELLRIHERAMLKLQAGRN
jgi:hypothetical protein